MNIHNTQNISFNMLERYITYTHTHEFSYLMLGTPGMLMYDNAYNMNITAVYNDYIVS